MAYRQISKIQLINKINSNSYFVIIPLGSSTKKYTQFSMMLVNDVHDIKSIFIIIIIFQIILKLY